MLQGVENLFERQERMVAYGPVFCDITWGAGGTTADVTLDIATRMQTQVGRSSFHLRCALQLLHETIRMDTNSCMRVPCADLRRHHDAPHVHQHAHREAG